jgi:hypothetical protein
MRKAATLSMDDDIEIFSETADATLLQVITEQQAAIRVSLPLPPLMFVEHTQNFAQFPDRGCRQIY